MGEYEGWAYRCSDCDINWPYNTAYRECPQCGGENWAAARTHSINLTEAGELVKDAKRREENRAKFEQYYERRAVREFKEQMKTAKW